MYSIDLKEIIIPIDFLIMKTCKGIAQKAKPTKLSADDKLLYIYLKTCYCYSNNKKELLDISQDQLVDVMGMSKKTIQRKIRLLVDAGLVSIVYTDRNNIYTVYDYTNADFSSEIDTTRTLHTGISDKPCQFYIQEWKAPFFQCVKFGIAYNTETRACKQHTESMFSHKIISIWDIPTRKLGLKLEKEIKKNFEHSGCLKIWAPDGFSETVHIENKDNVIDFVENFISRSKTT